MESVAQWLTTQFEKNPRINQTSLAISIGVAQSAVSNWLRGVSRPEAENCRKLAKYFGVPEQHVLVLAGHLSPNPGLLAETRASYRATRYQPILDLLDELTDEQLEDLRKFLESMI